MMREEGTKGTHQSDLQTQTKKRQGEKRKMVWISERSLWVEEESGNGWR